MRPLRRLARALRQPLKVRYEPFGGIIALEAPSALVFVDKDYLRSLGYADSPLWDSASTTLTAPTEVHLALTNRCNRRCAGCYMDSGEPLPGELGPEGMDRVVDHLADMGVFHLALGGGESFELDWLFDTAHRIRSKGMVPNITTNGSRIDEETAARCTVFGQINVSLDGVGPDYERNRDRGGFEEADRALGTLRRHHPRVGINVTLDRHNVDHLDAIVRYAKKKKLKEVEVLRFKPAGRGRELYPDRGLRPDQYRDLYPLVGRLTRRYRMPIKLDCSFVPMICFHRPDRRLLERTAVFGCEGGNVLVGMKPDGAVSGCSFDRSAACGALELADHWKEETAFPVYRGWVARAPEPCAGCDYLEICKGGCHVVAEFLTGSPLAPDPECPFVAGS